MLNFKGTIDRKTFWLCAVSTGIGMGVLANIVAMSSLPVAIFGAIVYVGLAYVNIAAYKARLNEAGWSGWWMLAPLLNIIVAGFFKAKVEENKYV